MNQLYSNKRLGGKSYLFFIKIFGKWQWLFVSMSFNLPYHCCAIDTSSLPFFSLNNVVLRYNLTLMHIFTLWLLVSAKYYIICIHLMLMLPRDQDPDCYHLPATTNNIIIKIALSSYFFSIQ